MSTPYPPQPVNGGVAAIVPSAAFKKEVAGVVINIIGFIAVYLLLVAASVVLAIACFYGGVLLMVSFPQFLVLLVGLGLMALGVSLVFFLIKFIFASRKEDNRNRIVVTEAEQPRLFQFIRQLTEETNTPFPKKIFLSPQVNAAVFYHSSFWSMFLPVKKNLEIGLGLVNCVNMGEFKAVMAHEFGHFSQRSMKLGSFTYNVNRIIYDMLYNNNSYSGFLNAWGRLHGALGLFASITVKIAQGIQEVLKEMYKFVNKSYLRLSREMEFHADAVAASVAGGNNLVAALNRIELASACYQTAVEKVNESLNKQEAADNLFANQLVVLQQLAREHGLPLKSGLPVISTQFIASFRTSRVNYKDQWASHPTNEERAASLEKLNMNVAPTEARAWDIFDNSEQLQQQMTKHLYAASNIETEKLSFYNEEVFAAGYLAEKESWQLPERFRDIFNGRYPNITAAEPVVSNNEPWLQQVANPEYGKLPSLIRSNEQDMQLLQAIADKQIDVQYVDFDGQKYPAAEAARLAETVKTEVEEQTKRLQLLDAQLVHALVQQFPGEYQLFTSHAAAYTDFETVAAELADNVRPFYHAANLTLNDVVHRITLLKNKHEPQVKNTWQQLITQGLFNGNETLQQDIAAFIPEQYQYFQNNKLLGEELDRLYNLIQQTEAWLARQKFVAFRQWLQAADASSLPAPQTLGSVAG